MSLQLVENIQTRHMVDGTNPSVLANVYQEDTNLVVWKRELSPAFQKNIQTFLTEKPDFKVAISVTPETVAPSLKRLLGDTSCAEQLGVDIAELVDMYCYLFDLKKAGLRLTALDRAMCPRFHVDRVPCRLVTTYVGTTTEWLAHENVDRSKLGSGNQGKTDEESGIYQNPDHISRLNNGDVALLKGELWENNEGAGLVHRSPSVQTGENRLLLTLDFL